MECKVRVHHETLRRFIKRRSKPRKPQPELDPEQLPLVSAEPLQSDGTGKKLTPEERAAQVEYIRSLNQPALQEQPAKARWNFAVDKPRTLHKP